MIKKQYPFVSLCTPTFNRRHFFPILFEMFKLQTYPRTRMEWIILDDGTDPIGDLIQTSGIEQIRYIQLPTKLSLGAKRNLIHTHCTGSILVYVDDDDYFPPERVSHSVDMLMNAPHGELIAGSSEIYLYFREQGLYQFGPYGPNHATAGTFAFKRELLLHTRYDDTACIGEESFFLKKYTLPMIQLDPVKTILVFPHGHNSFDKHTLLHNPMSGPMKKCTDKTIDTFIHGLNATLIQDFFLNTIHTLLREYTPGEPHMKPDVELQTRQIQIQRNMLELQLREQQHAQQFKQFQQSPQYDPNAVIHAVHPDGRTIPVSNQQLCERIHHLEKELERRGTIMLQQPDGVSVPLTNEQACHIIMEQQKCILSYKKQIDDYMAAKITP